MDHGEGDLARAAVASDGIERYLRRFPKKIADQNRQQISAGNHEPIAVPQDRRLL
jgi:hypothetical protein